VLSLLQGNAAIAPNQPVPVAQLACKGKKIIDSKYCFEIGLSKK